MIRFADEIRAGPWRRGKKAKAALRCGLRWPLRGGLPDSRPCRAGLLVDTLSCGLLPKPQDDCRL